MYIPVERRDFYSETNPLPARIMAKEGEHTTATDYGTYNDDPTVAIVRRVQTLFSALPPITDTVELEFQKDGGRTYYDVKSIERAGPESLGPREQLLSEMAGQLMIQAACQQTVGPADAFYRRAGGYGIAGAKSMGFHENLLTPTYESHEEQLHDAEVIGTHLATRVLWSGAGLITDRGYRFSQKAHDVWRPDDMNPSGVLLGIGHYGERLAERKKPMLAWSRPTTGSGMESHAGDMWERLEVRYADAHHSPWARFMTMATTSLVLRMLEHKSLFEESTWQRLRLSNMAEDVLPIANDMTLSNKLALKSGEHATALELQHMLADMAIELTEKRILPDDEVEAAHEWKRVCLDLDNFSYWNPDTLDLIRDRVEWAGRLYLIHRQNERHHNMDINRDNKLAVGTELLWDRIHPIAIADKYWRKMQPDFYADNSKEIEWYMHNPPRFTRAFARVRALKQGFRVKGGKWQSVEQDSRVVRMPDPYDYTVTA